MLHAGAGGAARGFAGDFAGDGASIWTNFGILGGNAVYFALSATGLGAVLVASYGVFSLIRWVGAAYLMWPAAGRATALVGRERFRTLGNHLAGSLLIGAGVGLARIRHA